MEVSDHEFSQIDAYVDCGLTREYDTPILNVSGWKGVSVFYKGQK